MTDYRIASSRDHELDSLSSCSCKFCAAAVPRLSLHPFKADLIKTSSSEHVGIQNEDSNSSSSFILNSSSWHASIPDHDRRSLASPAPFTNLLDEQEDVSSEERNSVPPLSRPQHCWPLPRQSFSNRKRQSQCHIALQQQTTSEICLPLPSRLSRAQFFQNYCISEDFSSPKKSDENPHLFHPGRRSSARAHRISIGRPLPESFVHFCTLSNELRPDHRQSFVSRGNLYQSFDGATRDLSLSTNTIISDSVRPVSEEIELPATNSKAVSVE